MVTVDEVEAFSVTTVSPLLSVVTDAEKALAGVGVMLGILLRQGKCNRQVL